MKTVIRCNEVAVVTDHSIGDLEDMINHSKNGFVTVVESVYLTLSHPKQLAYEKRNHMIRIESIINVFETNEYENENN